MPTPAVQPETARELERQLRSVEEAIRAGARGDDAPNDAGQSIVSLETRWAALTRDVAAARERYQSTQRRLFNAIVMDTAQATGAGTQLIVAEEAYFPKRPIKRGPLRTRVGAALAVLMLGVLIALGLGFLDPRVTSVWDLERLGIAPIVLVVPQLPRKKRRR
jgi:hypothetical protein